MKNVQGMWTAGASRHRIGEHWIARHRGTGTGSLGTGSWALPAGASLWHRLTANG